MRNDDRPGAVPACDLALLFPRWSADKFRRTLRLLLGKSDAAGLLTETVSVADRLAVGLWEFMEAVGFVSDAQGRAVVAAVRPALAAGVTASGGVVPAFQVTFVERRWVVWPGRTTWFDMWDETDVAELPEPGVLYVTCDVSAMYIRQERWFDRLKGGTDAGRGRLGGRPQAAGGG